MDEYISREETLKAFKLTAKNSNKDYQRGLQDAIDCLVPEVIAGIPSADVQPVKHGRWKHIAGMNSKCSEFERYFPVQEFDSRPFDINFCPHCGARMDLGDEKT